nr:sperm-associated antigen 4 protein-like [Anas platyrhynchos]
MLQEHSGVAAQLSEEIGTLKKELKDLRDAVSVNSRKKSEVLLDWALKSTGATIDLERSSKTYSWDGMRSCRLFWLPCTPNPPDTILQPDVSLGNCWAFQGSRGQVVIRLPAKIQATMVTVHHTSDMDSALGKFSSAPRDFTVSGVDEETEAETLLGTFTYAVQKKPVQTFPLQVQSEVVGRRPVQKHCVGSKSVAAVCRVPPRAAVPAHGRETGWAGRVGTRQQDSREIPRAFQVIKVVIQSNWGNPDYTCIYRVQVHGRGTATSRWPGDMSSANKNKK